MKFTFNTLFTKKEIFSIIIGCAILSFGLHNIHGQSEITEGGALGSILLLHHWFHIPSSVSSILLDITCYGIAYRFLGKNFLIRSACSTLCFSCFLWLWEQFPFMLPNLYNTPFFSAILGGVFVGIGVGIIVRLNLSASGDDALALTIHHKTGIKIAYCYLLTDLTVLCLSLSYISIHKIIYSFITVIISSKIIDYIKEYQHN